MNDYCKMNQVNFIDKYDLSPTYLWNKQCCCEADCCWDHCDLATPPEKCLQGVQNSKWIFNNNLGYYQAFQHTGLLGMVQYFLCELDQT